MTPAIPRILLAAACALTLALVHPSGATAHAPDAVGGGYAHSGMLGSYFANPDFEGAPAFRRRDVRIDFDWGVVLPVGGSTAEPYRSFPTDGFSIRWEGVVIPRFSEPYQFVGYADDSIRIRLRASASAPWKTLVDRSTQAGAFESEPVELLAGRSYELEIEYVEREGEARCDLAWTSPSTPREIIDPVTQQGLNAASFAAFMWADLMKTARFNAEPEELDEAGWPKKTGAELILAEMDANDDELSGTYLLRFEGRAKVRHTCCSDVQFESGGARFDETLPRGVGYDPARNVTEAVLVQPGSRSFFFFDDANRSPGGAPGLTEVHFFRPLAPGSTKYHEADEVVYRPMKSLLQDDFTAIRWLEGANRRTESDWADRALPTDMSFLTRGGSENWEYLVILANETGKDLYLTTPVAADDVYFEKLALLLRYGSDGRDPYREVTKNPVYPPLNPNLRVYVEVGNEIWNWAFDSTVVAQELTMAEAEKGSATWAAIDFDGDAGEPDGIVAVRRWLAYRTVVASRAFRTVFGDDDMGPRVRMLLEYQYNDFQETASSSLSFLDAYLATGHGDGPARPVSYDLWGSGGATYYAFVNKLGAQTHTVFRDPSFEETVIPAGTRVLRPKGSAWTFEGKAGVVHPTGPGPINDLEKLAKPADGKQAAFLQRGGVISQRIVFPRPGSYAIAFNAAGIGEGWPGHMQFSMYVDDQKINPRSQSDVRIAEGWWTLAGWLRKIDDLSEEWGSAVFQIDTPGPHTIRFVGADEDHHLLLDNIRIASVDAILESGFDAGEAQGQVGDANLAEQFRSQAKYARSFGLQVVAYEAGWSLGGDFNQIPLQNWAKLKDPRARAINDRVIELWDQSGSFMSVWGVYRYWPDYDMDHAALYPIMQSFRGASERLRTEATYGAMLPATLSVDAADWSGASSGVGARSWWRRYIPWFSGPNDREWYSWMLIAPVSRRYSVSVSAEGEGSVQVEIDGEVVATSSELGSTLRPLSVNLTKGAHAIRVVAIGDVDLRGVDIQK